MSHKPNKTEQIPWFLDYCHSGLPIYPNNLINLLFLFCSNILSSIFFDNCEFFANDPEKL